MATTTTAADGTYSFTTTTAGMPLPPGTYKITEAQPAGYLQGTNTVGTVNGVTDGVLVPVDMIGSIVLGQGQSSVGNNFGEVLPVTLAGNVYDDLNGDRHLNARRRPDPRRHPHPAHRRRASWPRPPPRQRHLLLHHRPPAPRCRRGPNDHRGPAGRLPPGHQHRRHRQRPARRHPRAGRHDRLDRPELRPGSSATTSARSCRSPSPAPSTTTDRHRGPDRRRRAHPRRDPHPVRPGRHGRGHHHHRGRRLLLLHHRPAGAPLPPGTYKIAETQPAGFLQGTNTVGTVNGEPDGILVPVDMIGSIVLTSGQASISNNFGEVLPVALSGTVYDDVTAPAP